MKRVLLLIAIVVATVRCYSQQQVAVETNAWSWQVMYTNSQGEVMIRPAPPEALRWYEQNPEPYGTNELESITIGYLFQTNAGQAIVTLQRMLKKDPNNVGTIRWLGRCYMLNKQPEAAIDTLKMGLEMGDEKSVLTLGAIYRFQVGNYKQLTLLIPKIVEIRKQTKDEDDRHDATCLLLAYLVRVDPVDGGEKILAQALDGLSDKFMVANPDVASLAIPALEKYHQSDWATQLQREVNVGTSTNRPEEQGDSIEVFMK